MCLFFILSRENFCYRFLRSYKSWGIHIFIHLKDGEVCWVEESNDSFLPSLFISHLHVMNIEILAEDFSGTAKLRSWKVCTPLEND